MNNVGKITTSEEAREKGRKGGIASGQKRRQKKDLKNTAQILLNTKVEQENIKNQLMMMGIDADDITYQMAMLVGVLNKAMKGDINAAKYIRETLGEDPEMKLKLKLLNMDD